MTINGWLQISLYLVVLLTLAKPLGWYMARVYEGQSIWLDRLLGPVKPRRTTVRIRGRRSLDPKTVANLQNKLFE